jgi:hypothetical protein
VLSIADGTVTDISPRDFGSTRGIVLLALLWARAALPPSFGVLSENEAGVGVRIRCYLGRPRRSGVASTIWVGRDAGRQASMTLLSCLRRITWTGVGGIGRQPHYSSSYRIPELASWSPDPPEGLASASVSSLPRNRSLVVLDGDGSLVRPHEVTEGSRGPIRPCPSGTFDPPP